MKSLFDSKGQHIANQVNEKLYSPDGQNIGHYLSLNGFFIDPHGFYLGEVAFENRLLYRINSRNENICYGSYGNANPIGRTGSPGSFGSIAENTDFKDIFQ